MTTRPDNASLCVRSRAAGDSGAERASTKHGNRHANPGNAGMEMPVEMRMRGLSGSPFDPAGECSQ